MLFRGYLPIMSGWQMAQFFNSSGIRFRQLKPFLLQNAERVKRQARMIAEQEKRPYVYLHEKVRKEEMAKEIAPTGPCPGRTDLYSFGHGALSDVLIPDGKRKTLRGL